MTQRKGTLEELDEMLEISASERWEALGIANDFLFGKVMLDPEICMGVLRRILPDIEIDHIEYPELQKTIKPDADARSVRLDVYVNDGRGSVFDVEMQCTLSKSLPKRSRYYGSMIDMQLIDKGQPYKQLNRSYVIFICLDDAFGAGRHIYSFENICREDTGISLKDGTTKIFLNANGIMDDVGPELKAFLDYVAGRFSEDAFVRQIDAAVKKAKRNREWRHEYMTLLMRDQENIEKGRELGLAEGIEKGRAEGIREIAINLAGMGFPVEQIAEAVKHSPAQVLEWVSDETID